MPTEFITVAEVQRLRALNAELLAALEWANEQMIDHGWDEEDRSIILNALAKAGSGVCPNCGGDGTSFGGTSDLPYEHGDTKCHLCGGSGEAPIAKARGEA